MIKIRFPLSNVKMASSEFVFGGGFLFYFFMTDAKYSIMSCAKKKISPAPFYVATRNPATGEWAFLRLLSTEQ